jgi:RNA polymerase sigma factor (sigma-70 family)
VNEDLLTQRDDAIRLYRNGDIAEIRQAVAELTEVFYAPQLAFHARKYLKDEADGPELIRNLAKHLSKPWVHARWKSDLLEWWPWTLCVLSEVAAIRNYQTGNPEEILTSVTHLTQVVYKTYFLIHARKVTQPADVDDLLQDLVLHLSQPRIRDRWNSDLGEFLPWARRVMSGLASDDRRTAETQTRHLERYLVQETDDHFNKFSIADDATNREFWQTLNAILDEMRDSPDPHEKLCYEVFVRRHIHEQTLQQIADELGLTISQVRTLITQSNDMVRRRLWERGHREPPPAPYRRPDPPSSED